MPTRQAVQRQHAQTVKRLLLAEAGAKKMLAEPVDVATARVQAAVAASRTASQRRNVLAAIRQFGPGLRNDARMAALLARGRSRELARDQLAYDTHPVRQWAEENGQEQPPLIVTAPHATELDAVEADRVASSVHTSWASALLSSFAQWDRKDGTDTGALIRALDVTGLLDRRMDSNAATTSAQAFNDERASYWDDVAGTDDSGDDSGGDGDTPAWQPAMFHVWSAVLDERTCEDCANLDGATVGIDEEFEDGAECPLHPNCRCVVLTTFDEDEIADNDTEPTLSSFRSDIAAQIQGATLRDLTVHF